MILQLKLPVLSFRKKNYKEKVLYKVHIWIHFFKQKIYECEYEYITTYINITHRRHFGYTQS